MNDDLEIRRAGLPDAPAILALTRAAYAPWAALIGREPKPMQADYRAALARHRIDLAYRAGRLAGLIETSEEPGALLVENVAVSPDFQGQGLGRTLMAHAEQLARSQGYGTIRLYTNQRFARNVQLYLRLGYRVDREEVLPVGVAVHMSKRIVRT